jgi:hypothetical protein
MSNRPAAMIPVLNLRERGVEALAVAPERMEEWASMR